jgi:hypothetical protein
MKWFTPAWARDEGDHAAVSAAYQRHSTQLRSTAPEPVAQLIGQRDSQLRLDDAIILNVLRVPPSNVRLEVIQGELDTGYGLLRLDFENADVLAFPPPSGDRQEVRYVEFDAGPRERFPLLYEMRALLWPDGELAISFENVSWQWDARADRSR